MGLIPPRYGRFSSFSQLRAELHLYQYLLEQNAVVPEVVIWIGSEALPVRPTRNLAATYRALYPSSRSWRSVHRGRKECRPPYRHWETRAAGVGSTRQLILGRAVEPGL